MCSSDLIKELTDYKYFVSEISVPALSKRKLPRPPKGKRTLVPENIATAGIKHIRQILSENQEIELILVPSLQATYWLQKEGFIAADESFLHGAQPRRDGIASQPPYYQPVNPKVFKDICALPVSVPGSEAKLIPLLPVRDYPLKEKNIESYLSRYESIKTQL